MADGAFRYTQASGHSFAPYTTSNIHSSRPRVRRHGSPQHHSRFDLAADTPSPSRTPGRRSSPGNGLSMYGPNHQQGGHGVFMNGGNQGHPRYGMHANSKPFSSSAQQSSHVHRTQQDHHGQAQTNFVSHSHNGSTPAFSHATPNFAPSQNRNGNTGHHGNGAGRQISEHYSKQLECYARSREALGSHFHAKDANMTKNPSLNGIENRRNDTDHEERNRAVDSQDVAPQRWTELDMGGQGVRNLTSQLFAYPFLTSLFLNGNKLQYLPPAIGQLRKLTHLDLSQNELVELPSELGMLVNLKSLWLFDNQLETLPSEIGYLHQLDILGLEGNPMDNDLSQYLAEEGPKALISQLREEVHVPDVDDRPIIDTVSGRAEDYKDTVSAMTYNILCDRYATRSQYGYASDAALHWDYRRDVILNEIQGRNTDIVCLQEVDTESYHEFFRPELAHKDYKGVFHPKMRARTMNEKEARLVDGCATFWNNTKYIKLDSRFVDLSGTALARNDMRSDVELFNRVMNKDNIATVTFLEDRQTGARLIVVNTHIFWDHAFADVKVVQVAILMEELARIADNYTAIEPCKDKAVFRYSTNDAPADTSSKEPEGATTPSPPTPPAPSQEYTKGASIPLLLCGDFNSLPDSGPYELLSTGSLRPDHPDLSTHKYGDFTRVGMTHPFALASAYSPEHLQFTNYTPGFTGVIDYIWYSTGSLEVLELLGDVDPDYLKRVPGFPNIHFPSDHVALVSKFAFKPRKGALPAKGKDTGT